VLPRIEALSLYGCGEFTLSDYRARGVAEISINAQDVLTNRSFRFSGKRSSIN
jgi:hypothetical protein